MFETAKLMWAGLWSARSRSFPLTIESGSSRQIIIVTREPIRPGDRLELRLGGILRRAGCITFARDGRYTLTLDRPLRADDDMRSYVGLSSATHLP